MTENIPWPEERDIRNACQLISSADMAKSPLKIDERSTVQLTDIGICLRFLFQGGKLSLLDYVIAIQLGQCADRILVRDVNSKSVCPVIIDRRILMGKQRTRWGNPT